MGPGLGDFTVGYDKNLIGPPDRVQTVGDNQERLAPTEFIDSLLDVTLIVGVHTGSCFIQNYNRGIL